MARVQVQSKLFALSQVDGRNELEERMSSGFRKVQDQITNLPDRDAHDKLIALAQTSYDDVCLGLLFGILTNPTMAPKYCRDLTVINRDGLAVVLTNVNKLTFDCYPKLLDVPRQQLLFFVKHCMKAQVPGPILENVCIVLLRFLVGGDVSPKTLWLAETLASTLLECRSWLDRNSAALSHAVYTFLRILCDHFGQRFDSLRQLEITLCVSLLKEKFVDCMQIGRDLVRLLLQVAAIPELMDIFSLLIVNPAALAPPPFRGIQQLLQMRTPKLYLINRLTPDMETRLFFMAMQVKSNSVNRYQTWFAKSYLSTPESQSLRVDLIRYICRVVHPPNEVLASDVTQRWSIIMWLLQQTTVQAVVQFCRLALFFDWFFYELPHDTIMNIEPGILLMFNGLRSAVPMTAGLLDFLLREMDELCVLPELKTKIRDCVTFSFRQIIELRVVPSLMPLFESPKLDRELRAALRSRFPEFFSGPDVISENRMPGLSDASNRASGGFNRGSESPVVVEVISIPDNSDDEDGPLQINDDAETSFDVASYEDGGASARFSDEEDDFAELREVVAKQRRSRDEETAGASNHYRPAGGGDDLNEDYEAQDDDEGGDVAAGFSNELLEDTRNHNGDADDEAEDQSLFSAATSSLSGFASALANAPPMPAIDLNAAIARLPTPEFRRLVEKVQNSGADSLVRCDNVQRVLMELYQEEELDEDQAEALADCFVALFSDSFKAKIFPRNRELTEEVLEESVTKPFYVMLRNLCLQSEDDPCRQRLLVVLSEMYRRQQRVGYHLLYFMRASDQMGDQMLAYRDLCNMLEPEVHIEDNLAKDMLLCEEDDHDMFAFLIPDVYSKLSKIAIHSPELMHVVVSTSIPLEMNSLVCRIVQGSLTMLGKEGVQRFVSKSLSWESVEQYFFWQLLSAHEIKVEWIVPLINKLKYPDHAEALMYMMLLFRRSDLQPTVPIVRSLLLRSPSPKADLFTTGALQVLYDADADRLVEVISSAITKSLKKPSAKDPTTEQILGHLDAYRQNGKDSQSFFTKEPIQSALRDVQESCSNSVKASYSELFAVMEVLEKFNKGNRQLRRSRKPAQNDESSDEDSKAGKQPPKKRPKRVTTPDSDSD